MHSFALGEVTVSQQAAAALSQVDEAAAAFLARHQSGDWGEVDEVQRRANEFGATCGHGVISRYRLPDGTLLRVATAVDQAVTAVQMDSEFIYGVQIGVREGYALWADRYDRERNPLIALEESLLPALEAELRPATVLDVGTGTGRHALRWARRSANVTAFDQSAEMLESARRSAAREQLQIAFHQGVVETGLPVPSGSFDLVICALMLCHVLNLSAAIAECARAVRPGGHLLITDFHPQVTSMGWQTEVVRPDVVYRLPTSRHRRDDYLRNVEAAGCVVTRVLDGLVRDAPAGYTSEDFIRACGDLPFCLVVMAVRAGETG